MSLQKFHFCFTFKRHAELVSASLNTINSKRLICLGEQGDDYFTGIECRTKLFWIINK